MRALGYLILLISASSILNMIDVRYGGMIGALFPYFFVPLISSIGVVVVLIVGLMASLLLITDLTFLSIFERMELPLANLKRNYHDWQESRRLQREQFEETFMAEDARKKKKTDRKSDKLPDTIVQPTISVGADAEKKTIPIGVADTSQNVVSTNETQFVPDDELPFEVIPVSEGSVEIPSNGNILDAPIKEAKRTGELSEQPNDAPTDTELKTADEAVLTTPAKPRAPADIKQALKKYKLPDSKLLNPSPPHIEFHKEELQNLAAKVVEKTAEFNVAGNVMNICPGPVVTTYEFKPDAGVKYSRVTGLVDDLCLALQAESIRIDRIPGKAVVGIEVPNRQRETIFLRSVIESKKFKASESKLSIALGQTIDGLNYVTDLAKMPHLLIAGATGAGKSVGVNSLVVSILYKAKPDEVKFIMVDPKRLELGLYADIPHLATPIITDPKKAAVALRWAVREMEKRYKDLAQFSVRNIDTFNSKVPQWQKEGKTDDNGDVIEKLPFIVIIIDELADLMMVAGKEVEESITRLAQMARAVGIHLVLATQRPSVDVITGLIKANFPARISFRVSSKIDSRTIIDGNGAEGLLGRGDMLFLPPGTSQVLRVHGAYVDEDEIAKIVGHIKDQFDMGPIYDESITKSEEENNGDSDMPGRNDPLFWDAVKVFANAKRGSTSLLQRHLKIGYGRAAGIIDAMVAEGFIGEMEGSTKARPVLPKAYEALQDMMEMQNEQ